MIEFFWQFRQRLSAIARRSPGSCLLWSSHHGFVSLTVWTAIMFRYSFAIIKPASELLQAEVTGIAHLKSSHRHESGITSSQKRVCGKNMERMPPVWLLTLAVYLCALGCDTTYSPVSKLTTGVYQSEA